MSRAISSWLSSLSKRSGEASKGQTESIDVHSDSMPSHQNAIDLLPGWNHAFPPELNLVAGEGRFDQDPRILWAIERFGPLEGKRVLELGPLEGQHTAILERCGARRIDAVEGNKLAFLRCLVAKEIYDLRRSHFLLGDFVRGLARPIRYDFIVASGVLYHMSDPLLLLERIAARTDAVYIWTHYFDDEAMSKADLRRFAFQSPDRKHEETVKIVEFHGVKVKLHLRSYYKAWQKSQYCGGPVDRHFWMEKADLIAVLRALGFNDLSFAHEAPDHPNGPAISIFARRTGG
jgi:protein-L-isoaspartate O-methyltransferase